MRPQLSIIIPTLNASATLGPCLASLMPGLDLSLVKEVILSDGGSEDEIAEIAEQLGCELIIGTPGRGAQNHRGSEIARAEMLFFIHADTVLSPDWAGEIATLLGRPGWQDRAFCAGLRFDHKGLPARLVASWANLRSRLFGLPYGDQTLLISAKLYKDIGGFAPIPLMEDVAIAGKLRGRLKMLKFTAQTSAEKYRRSGWLRQGARNLSLLLRYKLGADPAQLAEDYRQPLNRTKSYPPSA